MTIRSKLLALLLALAGVPLVLFAGFSLRGTSELGARVGERSREAMTQREQRHLEEKLSDGSVIFQNQVGLLAHLIRDQAKRVEAELRRAGSPGEDASRLGADARDFDAGLVETIHDERYMQLRPDGTTSPIEVALDRIVLLAPPTPSLAPPSPTPPASEADAAANVSEVEEGGHGNERDRLARMLSAYREIHDLTVAQTLWHYTALESGLHSSYPGHGGYPADFDPRDREWYRAALQAEGPVWSLPSVDVSTRAVVLTISTAVRGPSGELAGVTAIDMAVPEVFNVFSAAPRAADDTSEAMLVVLEDSGGMRVFGRERQGDAGLPWDAPLETEWLEDTTGLLRRHFEDAAANDAVGMLRHPQDGADALWAFKKLNPQDAYLVVVVPIAQVVARANAMEAFVAGGFREQASVIGLGFVFLVLLVIAISIVTARSVTSPLAALSDTARAIASGEFATRSSLARRDEIGSLSDSINEMAESIENLLTAQEEAYLQALKSLMKALGSKDRYTAAHSSRVNRYSLRLGRRLGLDAATLDLLGRAALVHDIGKIGIPDEILNKPAPLDDDEYQVMRQHPKFSAAIMRPLSRFKVFAEIAAWHHERWDGQGYPDGLAGEEIPFLARIVAIADAWDAMTDDRIYRKGFTVERASAMLEEDLGNGQFDPDLLREFIDMVREDMASEETDHEERVGEEMDDAEEGKS